MAEPGRPPLARRDVPGRPPVDHAPGGDAHSAAPEPPPPSTPSDEPVVDLRERGLFDAAPTAAAPTAAAPPSRHSRRRGRAEDGAATATHAPPAPPSPAAEGPTPIDPWQPVDPSVWNPAEGWRAAGQPKDTPPPAASVPPNGFLPPNDLGPPEGGGEGGAALPPPGPAGAVARAPIDDPPVHSSPARPGMLTRRVLWSLAPSVLAVLLTATLSAGLIARAGSASARGAEQSSAAVAQYEVRSIVDGLWTDVLAVVASGVGQGVASPADVQAKVGQLRGADATPEGTPESLAGAAERAVSARAEFADAVERTLEESGGGPLELGNALTELSERHLGAQGSTTELADGLAESAEDERAAASRSRAGAIAVLLLGLVGAGVALMWTRRRVREGVDLPVARLHDAVHRMAAGEPAVRSRAGGLPELAALGSDFDEVVHDMGDRLDDLRRRAEWSQQSRMIVDALDLADDEESLFDVVTRALGMIDPARPVELLLTDRGPNRLTVVAANPNVERPGTPPNSAGACVALRRGQVAVFDSSSSINSCPMLRQRPGGELLSGACVPVTVAGKPVGVIHMTGPELEAPEAQVVERLVSLASQLGNRLGALRTLESSRHEASTDGLTGLPNRRSLEAEVAALLERGTPFVMVLADLDKFKRLNDNFGHEIGDRALQLFAGVLRDNVRGNDVVGRLGGEEFVLVYPNMSVEISVEAIGRLRAALARAVAASPLPGFTCSFGITHSTMGVDGESILRIADAGLLRAKEQGGDQAVVADATLAAAVFSGGTRPPAREAGKDDPRR